MFVPPAVLPVLSLPALDGSFLWLPELRPRGSPLDYADAAGGLAEGVTRLDGLREAIETRGLLLPKSFIRFMTTPQIYSRVPSITACYLDPSKTILDEPSGHRAPLVRFLTDSQACVAWYLQLIPGGKCPVLGTWDLHYNQEGELVPRPGRAHLVAWDFESFVYRFWLENLIWLKVTWKESLTHEESAYLHAARQGAALVRPFEEHVERK